VVDPEPANAGALSVTRRIPTAIVAVIDRVVLFVLLRICLSP
jgi:hypothetical protein